MRAPGSGAHHELSGVGHVKRSSLADRLFPLPILGAHAQAWRREHPESMAQSGQLLARGRIMRRLPKSPQSSVDRKRLAVAETTDRGPKADIGRGLTLS
jgi:hypothetical protein